jgi:signal transduction histidine kinase/ActR/RegA family two-component response regulator
VDIEVQIRAARLRAVFERLPVTLAITMVTSAAATFVLAASGAGRMAWAWLALLAGLTVLRAALWLRFRQAGIGHAGVWLGLALGGAFASGLAWGLGVVLLPVTDSGVIGWTGPAVMLLLLAAMCAGAATVHGMHMPVALAFVLPACLPLAVDLAARGGTRHLLMAAAVLLFAATMAWAARRSAWHFGDTLRLQIELARRTRELDAANAALRAEIEDHRATGETLRQAQRMEAIGQLSGGIAHDFNNVLAVIGGNLQLIGKRGAGNADILRLVAAAERATERGARLTASLLSFSREQRLRPEEVDLNEMLREAAPMLRRTLHGRMELALELAPERLVALADPAQLQAALLHLVINARDASPPGRKLTIATSLVAMDEAGALTCVRVSDTGPGMAPEVAARAFEPFFTTREVGQGSGLGLSQVHGFAHQSGGTARIEQPPEGGVAVSLLLPAVAVPMPEPVAPAVEELAFAGRVLLVEDDADVREVLMESLAASGWEVTQAEDGAAACAVLEGDVPLDILVTDVVMPGVVSGVALVRAAARLRPELPVLLISGYPTATLAAQGAEEAEMNLLRKPFTHGELLSRMRQARQAAGCRPVDRPVDQPVLFSR